VDRTTTIIRYQWRAYWRRLSRGGKTSAGNQGIALLIMALIFIRYLKFLRLAAINLSQGKTALFEVLLIGIFLAWLFPLAGGGQPSVATRRWLHLPLSLRELLRFRIVSLLMPPSAWIVIVASLTLSYPLAQAQRPLLGMMAGFLFVAAAGFLGLTVSHLMSIAFWRRLLVNITIIGSSAIAVLWTSGQGGLKLLTALPSTLVAQAAVGQRSWIAIAVLFVCVVVTYRATLWSLRLSLENSGPINPDRSTTLALLSFPGRLGGLLAKDFRYFRRLLDVYLGLLAAAAGCVYLVTAEIPTRGIYLAFIVIVFLLGAAVPFNSFGLDTHAGLDRYSLLPLSGKSIIFSKNLAYLIVITGQVLPLIMLAGWRLGTATSTLGIVEALALACAYLAWGNWMSINHPMKMQFFRFASSGGALADVMAGVVFGSLPGILMIYFLHAEGNHVSWMILAVMLLFAALYCASVTRFGRRFEQRREAIASVLS